MVEATLGCLKEERGRVYQDSTDWIPVALGQDFSLLWSPAAGSGQSCYFQTLAPLTWRVGGHQ